MHIPKEQILDLLRGQGRHDQADQADRELPGTVDTDQHGGMLEKHGIDLGQLSGLLGSLRGKLPGL